MTVGKVVTGKVGINGYFGLIREEVVLLLVIGYSLQLTDISVAGSSILESSKLANCHLSKGKGL